MPLTALKQTAAFRDRLRDATLPAHQRLDGLLAGGLSDAAAYHGYLRGMHRFISDAECALAAAPRRSMWLAADLVALRLAPLAPDPGLQPLADADQHLGWRYVIAGSSLGARLLVRDARRLGFDADHGANFLHRLAGDGDWARVLHQLRDAPAACEAGIVQGAGDAFAAAERSLRRALLPDLP